MAEKVNEQIQLGVIGQVPIHIRPGILGALYHQVLEGRVYPWQRFWFLFRGESQFYWWPFGVGSLIVAIVTLFIAIPPVVGLPEDYNPSLGLALVLGIWSALVLAPLFIELILHLAFRRLERETEASKPLIHAAMEKRFSTETADETTPHLALGDVVAFEAKVPGSDNPAHFYARIRQENYQSYLHIWQ